MHETTSMLAWFDCETCDGLEVAYSESLDWHYHRITGAIAQAARVERKVRPILRMEVGG